MAGISRRRHTGQRSGPVEIPRPAQLRREHDHELCEEVRGPTREDCLSSTTSSAGPVVLGTVCA